jgi:hypothetical protein
MGAVLTTATGLLCPHQGTVQTSSDAKLTVQQSPVLTNVVGDKVNGCIANTQCGSVTTVTSPPSSKLQAGGSPVLLDSLVATTATAAPVSIKPGTDQTKLTAS